MQEWEQFKTKINLAVTEWFTRQCADSGARHYVYFVPAYAKHDSGLVIAQDQPANTDYIMATDTPMNTGATIPQEIARLESLFFKLPVLKN